jgi:hypothetical protein
VSYVRGGLRKGLRPLSTVEVPSVDKGAVKRDEQGEIIREKLTLDGISVFRRALSNTALAEREAAQKTDDGRRSAARKEAERLRQAGFISAEAESAVGRVLWTLKHAKDDKARTAITEGLLKLAHKYAPAEPFPEKRTNH